MATSRLLSLRDAGADAWNVYADELLASPRSDDRERGELIRLQLELERAEGAQRATLQTRERELIARTPSLGGPDAVLARLDATWRRGFISRVQRPNWEGLRILLSHPSGALVDEFILNNPQLQLDDQVELIARSKPPLRALQIDSDDSGTRFEGIIECGPALQLPTLERASIVVRQLDIETRPPLVSPVRELTLGAPLIPWAPLDAATFPNLTRLDLLAIVGITWQRRGFSTNDQVPAPPVGPGPRFRSGGVTPKLEQLVLRNFFIDGTTMAMALELCASTPLRELDVRGCQFATGIENELPKLKCRVQL